MIRPEPTTRPILGAPTQPRVDAPGGLDTGTPPEVRRAIDADAAEQIPAADQTLPGVRRTPQSDAQTQTRPQDQGEALIPGIPGAPPLTKTPGPEPAPGREAIAAVESKAPEAATQPLPLQQAWTVERRPQPPALRRVPAATTSARAIRERVATESAPVAEGTPKSVDHMLAQVAAGAPTRSAIETLAPRRPRPEPVGRSVPSSTRRTPGPTTGLEMPHISDADRLHIEDESEAMVETPIGPLPADLWGLIGEPVPNRPVPDRQVSPTSLPSAGAPEGTVPTSSARQVHEMRTPVGGPSVIQRVAAETQMEDELPEAETSTPQSEDVEAPESVRDEATSQADREETPSSPDVDLDELARRVYEEVKRRLSLERERYQRRP